MDFKRERWLQLSDSKAYGQWESIMNNSGWFENKLESREFVIDNVSNLNGATAVDKIENNGNSKIKFEIKEDCDSHTKTRKCKAYKQWETIMNNSGWFENKLQSYEVDTCNVSNVDEATSIHKIENHDNPKIQEFQCEIEINTETRSCKAYEQWETIMNNSGWFENKLQSYEVDTCNVSNVDEATSIHKIEKE